MQDRSTSHLVPVCEARSILGQVSARWLWSNTAPRGPIPCVRLGRRVMYAVADLNAYASSQRLTQHVARTSRKGVNNAR